MSDHENGRSTEAAETEKFASDFPWSTNNSSALMRTNSALLNFVYFCHNFVQKGD